MNNHVHMMIGEGTEDVAKVMKRITVSYVSYFNKKYQRVGHLFQDRYRSEEVEADGYVLSLARYIHRNPIKAGMVKDMGEYPWSSYSSYLNHDNRFELDKELILGVLSNDTAKAKKEYIKYMKEESTDLFIDIKAEVKKMAEKEAGELYEKMLQERAISREGIKGAAIPEELIKEFKEKTKFSIREIAAITGLNKALVNRLTRAQTEELGHSPERETDRPHKV